MFLDSWELVMSKLGIQLRVGLGQKLMMTPQLQQAVKVLQLSRLELEQFVQDQIQENPTLEDVAHDAAEDGADAAKTKESSAEDFLQDQLSSATKEISGEADSTTKAEIDWENYSRMQDTAAPQSSTVRRQNEDDYPNYENIGFKSKDLREHLSGQVGELDFDKKELKIAELIIGNIDERGYLQVSIEELASSEQFELDDVDDILDTIQRLDPPGVAARSLKECLLNQLRSSHQKNGVIERIVSDHLSDLEIRNFALIAKALKITVEEVAENVEIISMLEPVPGRQYGNDSPQFIVPDVYVFKVGSQWKVAGNEEGVPKLKVSKVYSEMITNKQATGTDRDYLKDQVKSAHWLIKSIQQRQSTILKVAEQLVVDQIEFFEHGVDYLKPMILKDIAEKVEVHESTISRVTNSKYMHTPRGIFELKYFFNSAVSRVDGESLASESVKRMIFDMVQKEDPKKPLSDQKLADLLEEKNIQLARRTVAKYREQLNISSSSRRKKLF
jgi:RNA polymerase sigma-54 factor